MAKKSFYIFVSTLLGALLFLVLDRIIVFGYLFLVGTGYLSENFNYVQFAVADYFSLIIVLMLGGWYGVWLGMSWFAQVYEHQTHGGLADHIAKNLWPGTRKLSLESKMSDVRERLEKNLWEMETLAENSMAVEPSPTPKVRRVVRRKAAKKAGK